MNTRVAYKDIHDEIMCVFIGDKTDKRVNAEEMTDRIKGKPALLDFDSGPTFRVKLGLGFLLAFVFKALVCVTRSSLNQSEAAESQTPSR